jgi:hypothetical protein
VESLYMVISCVDRGRAWLEVAGGLSSLAPFLAPRDLVAFANTCISDKESRRPVAVVHGAPRAYGAAPAGTERLSPRHLPADAAVGLVINLIIR